MPQLPPPPVGGSGAIRSFKAGSRSTAPPAFQGVDFQVYWGSWGLFVEVTYLLGQLHAIREVPSYFSTILLGTNLVALRKSGVVSAQLLLVVFFVVLLQKLLAFV